MGDLEIPDNAAIRAAIVIASVYFAALWLALAVWAWEDAGQRVRSHLGRVLAVALVVCLSVPGALLYLLVRPRTTVSQRYVRSLEEELLLQELQIARACPTCKAHVEDDYLICPVCCAELKEECRRCGRILGFSWMACPGCRTRKASEHRGAAVPVVAGPAARPLAEVAGDGHPPSLRPQKDLRGGVLRPEDVRLVATALRDLSTTRPAEEESTAPASRAAAGGIQAG